MAINKSSAPRWVKVVIWVVAVSFVLSVGGLASLASLGSTPSSTSGQNAQGSTTATDTLSAISKDYSAKTQAIESQLAAKPDDAALLKAAGQQYYAWAGAILQATNNLPEARPIAVLSVQYYERAFAIAPGDSGDLTDYAAALFYSGDLAKATATAQAVVAKDPKYAPAYFDLGVFYAQAGRNADAIAAYKQAQSLGGTQFDAADLARRISDLEKQGSSSGATGTP